MPRPPADKMSLTIFGPLDRQNSFQKRRLASSENHRHTWAAEAIRKGFQFSDLKTNKSTSSVKGPSLQMHEGEWKQRLRFACISVKNMDPVRTGLMISTGKSPEKGAPDCYMSVPPDRNKTWNQFCWNFTWDQGYGRARPEMEMKMLTASEPTDQKKKSIANGLKSTKKQTLLPLIRARRVFEHLRDSSHEK